MAVLNNVLHYLGVPANVAASLRLHHHRRITIRHILLILAVSTVLCTLYYYSYLRRNGTYLALQDAVHLGVEPPHVWAERAAQVKEAFRYAYHGYEQHAYPYDELLPMSGMAINNFNGWGVSIVDSLDTMLLMGLEDEYARALPVIRSTNFSLPTNQYVPFFETVIRYLGGLLAAYAMTGDDLLREKADQLGTILSPAFDTNSGFPSFAVDTYSGKNFSDGTGILAEIASFQMEYAYLGKITGKKEHVGRATSVTDLLYSAHLSNSGGMYPTRWNLRKGLPAGTFLSVGAQADSGHEYTLKQFLMTARTDKRNLEMYLRFTSYVITNMLFLTPKRGLLYVTDGTMGKRWLIPSHNLEHLSCFFPGLLALGVHLLPLDNLTSLGIDFAALADDLYPADRSAYAALADFNLADLHMWAAEGIAETCYMTYADQPTGLGPEIVRMDVDLGVGAIRWIDELRAWKARGSGGWWDAVGNLLGSGSKKKRLPPGVGNMKPWTSPFDGNTTVESVAKHGHGRTRSKRPLPHTFGREYFVTDPTYYLRPETIESMYILWKTTGDIKWRHRGWEAFEAIERHAKTTSGYAVIENVCVPHPNQMDTMPSYFLAETLKYLYLMFLDEDPIPLDKWVFNTEAHALPVFEWTLQEKEVYGIV